MLNASFLLDKLILIPDDIDLQASPLRKDLEVDTYVLGAFNPGLTRLPNGNLLIMVRVAEALRNPVFDCHVHSIRWTPSGYVLEGYPLEAVDAGDPRKFSIPGDLPAPIMLLTSLSWLLPVELSPEGTEIIKIHYDRAIFPDRSSQEYGIEDARISLIEGKYYMTTCTVSSERHATSLFSSTNGLDYKFEGIILDHQNKDMLLFEGKIRGKYYALTRPLGSLYFQTGKNTPFNPGPSINLASSPDLFHWKPDNDPFIRPRRGKMRINRIGGGTPPILTPQGWLMLYHAVEAKDNVGIYRTYWALLDKDNPKKILHDEWEKPLLESNPKLTENLKEQVYLNDVVFTTGIIRHEEHFIVASGELDLACRISTLPESRFIV
jgi:predicted GH43/DUF377 family glycosyl hydrolase